jgi:5-methylcytosine-specific restriction endonuclease McrA
VTEAEGGRSHKGVCSKCKKEGGVTLHHIKPISVGGTNEKSNIAPLCRKCHRGLHEKFTNDELANIGGAIVGKGI